MLILFYSNDHISKQTINLIKKYNLQSKFNSIEISGINSNVIQKYVKTYPSIVDNNTIISRENILEFIVRLHLHLKKSEILPFYEEPSLYTSYYSKFDDDENNLKTDNKLYYSTNAFHVIKNEIPKIKIYSETTTLTENDFNKEYNKLLNDRNPNA